VRFGIRAPAFPVGSGPEELASYAARAESLGLSSFWVPDRLVPVGGYLSFTGAAPLLEPIWGSGRRGAPEHSMVGGAAMAPAVLRRLARLDGRLTRPTATVSQIVSEAAEVHREAESSARPGGHRGGSRQRLPPRRRRPVVGSGRGQ
jgi:hypothetical protein